MHRRPRIREKRQSFVFQQLWPTQSFGDLTRRSTASLSHPPCLLWYYLCHRFGACAVEDLDVCLDARLLLEARVCGWLSLSTRDRIDSLHHIELSSVSFIQLVILWCTCCLGRCCGWCRKSSYLQAVFDLLSVRSEEDLSHAPTVAFLICLSCLLPQFLDL